MVLNIGNSCIVCTMKAKATRKKKAILLLPPVASTYLGLLVITTAPPLLAGIDRGTTDS